MAWYLACCDNSGACFGFLKSDNTVCSNPNLLNDSEWCKQNLHHFKRKSDSSELVMQINLSHQLLPDGYPFRVVAYNLK